MALFFILSLIASVGGVAIVFWGASRNRLATPREGALFAVCFVLAMLFNVLGLVTR